LLQQLVVSFESPPFSMDALHVKSESTDGRNRGEIVEKK